MGCSDCLDDGPRRRLRLADLGTEVDGGSQTWFFSSHVYMDNRQLFVRVTVAGLVYRVESSL